MYTLFYHVTLYHCRWSVHHFGWDVLEKVYFLISCGHLLPTTKAVINFQSSCKKYLFSLGWIPLIISNHLSFLGPIPQTQVNVSSNPTNHCLLTLLLHKHPSHSMNRLHDEWILTLSRPKLTIANISWAVKVKYLCPELDYGNKLVVV